MEQTDERMSILGPPMETVTEVAVEKSEEAVTAMTMTPALSDGTEIVIGSHWVSGQAVNVAGDDYLDGASAEDGSGSSDSYSGNVAGEEGKDCLSESNHSVTCCQPVGFAEDDSLSKILDGVGAGDASGGNDSNSGDAAGYEGKDCVSESNHAVIALRWCGQGRQMSRRRVSRKCRNGAGGFESVFTPVVRRKRGSLSKRGRASVWGLLGNVSQLCTAGDASGKVKGGNGGSGSTRIRLKVKIGKEAKPSSLAIADSGMVRASESDGAAVSKCRTDSLQVTSSKLPTVVQDGVEEEGSEKQLQPLEDKLEKAKTSSDGSITDVNPTNKDSEGTVVSSVPARDAVEDYLRASSPVDLEALGVTAEKGDTDPATSPNSEVSNFVPEGQLGAKCNAAGTNKVKPLKKRWGGGKGVGDSCTDEIVASSASANVSSNSSSSKEFSPEQIPLSTETEIEVSEDTSKGESGAEAQICVNLDGDPKASELQNSEFPVPTTKSKESKGQRRPRKSDGMSQRRSVTSASRSRQRNGNKKKGNGWKSIDENKAKEKTVCDHAHKKDDSGTDNCIANEIGEFNGGDSNTSINVTGLSVTSSSIAEQCLPVDNAWVRCDDCHKWRRIAEELADSIGQTNCTWICAENIDKAFADCCIPQEMSNAEINAELGISDADEEAFDIFSNSMVPECGRIAVSKEHEFMRISTNRFLHRSRKNQTIDEIMVCGCKVPLDGGLGCRDGCLNRVLNIECIPGTCPCGDLCSNQQFQKRSYAKMKWDRRGKKGFGLRLEEDISRGQFLIEYVGEVLDMRTYQARLKEYASMGHKHFYFMTLDGSEVIDACAKGNLGRFINHSCDPNCRTEKWVVNGEICIGLFALKDIKKGEEVTFDYNYVRVVGAAAKKCYCGSRHCRGYIGGDPTNTEVIDQVDSDEEFPEPVMLEEGESWKGLKDDMTRASSFGVEMQVPENLLKDGNKMYKSTRAVVEPEIASEMEDSVNQTAAVVSQLQTSLDVIDSKRSSCSSHLADVSQQVEDVSSKTVSAVQPETSVEEIMGKTSSAIQMLEVTPTTMQRKVPSDCIVTSRKSKSASSGEKHVFVKSHFYIKTSGQPGNMKKGKPSANQSNSRKVQIMANQSEMVSWRPKKLMEVVANGQFETVEEKLNELLDANGGISKRKDSPRGYLQLLHLTAASGSSGNGETIQSNRDLSMILDAILKTRSQMVLTDIIHKNVLQKLHNMMKQCRRDFKKMPILRKVLKVLEYLAIREVLTLEHICKGPPHPGVESFIESILSLTEHDDKQVHQIARSFRDRWIPRHVRKICFLDREEERKKISGGANTNTLSASHNGWHDEGIIPTERMDTSIQPELPTTSVDAVVGGGTGMRKRKSRWDQDKPMSKSVRHDEQKVDSGLLQQSEFGKCGDMAGEVLDQAASYTDNREQNMQDLPPGFSSSSSMLMSSVCLLNATDMTQQNSLPDGLVVGHPQKKFISRLPVSYGIPLPIVQQFGLLQAEYVESWVTAPGMAFHPFPPLPSVPHPNKEAPSCSVGSLAIGVSEAQRGSHDPASSCLTENSPSTSGSNPSGVDHAGGNDQQVFKRPRGSSHDLGRRYFRQQKWNKSLPWIRNGSQWGNNSRGGMCTRNVGFTMEEHKNSCFAKDIRCRVENNFNQQAQLNDH